MVMKFPTYFLFGMFLIFGVFFGFNFVSSETAIGCWDYASLSTCENVSDSFSCQWDPNFPNASGGPNGGCFQNFSSGNETWGGMTEGAWQYDGNKTGCESKGNVWKPNDANQNTWCGISSLTDAQNKNPSAILSDIGCCEQTSCQSYNGNETACTASTTFNGLCYYENSSYGSGWCTSQSCDYAGSDEVKCNTLINNLYMPCTWNLSGSGLCEDSYGDGGFGAYDDSDSCFNAGGWYNSSGDCVTPTDSGGGIGGGGFLFGGEATCWFADNQPNICGNITGCAYCTSGNSSAPNDIANNNPNNICYGESSGYCEGHDVDDTISYSNANNSASLSCTDIGIKSACKYGPLPNCKWNYNTTNDSNSYCSVGATSERNAAPPVQYCEDPVSKNNYTVCSQLIEEFMMPCIWDNSSYPVKNCTFNSNAVFGSGGEKDFESINSESSCVAAGGSWNTEYYVDGGILKQDSWCETTGFFDIDNGGGEGNKGNCDSSCWACEFQSNGSAWSSASVAENACTTSALGYCKWTNDNSSAFNGLGWCDYPDEMEDAGALDCNDECGGCNFVTNPENACSGSVANEGVGCKWVNDTTDATIGGFCVDKTKKVCDTDCFSCFDTTSCSSSSFDCNWDPTFNLCSPNGFTGEICFNGVDDDSDNFIDCADPDCGFDNFCGGSSFGGDCFAQIDEGSCNTTFAFTSNGGAPLNCSWVNDTWNPLGRCDMPGANCWTLDNDLVTCGNTLGCTNNTASMGSNAWCEINKTKVDSASCWGNSNEVSCTGSCEWTNNTWANDGSGWCDYAPIAGCAKLNSSASCDSASNCAWQSDNYSETGGWCNIACFNQSISSSGGCASAGSTGLCEWKDISQTCQPETFMIFAQGASGGESGCGQYNGNQTACAANNVTCEYKNDTWANNNVTGEPAGWCMSKGEFENFGDMEGDIIMLADDSANINISSGETVGETGISGEVDIIGMGMKISDEGFNFGAGVFNMTKSIICNGQYIKTGFQLDGSQSVGTLGVGNKSGKFYWYLDTDGNESGGCVAYGGSNDSGYDFMINYIARNTTSGVVETKQLMRCASGAWSPTNALVTTSKQMSCGKIGGVMIGISSKDLEAFSEFDTTSNMRIFMSSANSSDDRTNPSDYVGPGYYTPGTIDFAFVDCSDPDTKNPKCKNIQKFGFNVFEECMNGIDDDENGLIDCADPMCSFVPKCAGDSAFNFSANSSDNVAPIIVYSNVEELSDAAFVRVDTNEPSNLNLTFYGNDSSCLVLNATIEDKGSGYQTNAEYKPFHNIDLIDRGLQNGTAYYYKTKTCDPSDNCAISACSNFTTKTSQIAKEFIFKINLPSGFTVDIPALNKTDYNFTESFNVSGIPTEFDVGIKTNTSVTRNMNITFNCGDMSIGFFGVNVLSPTKIDLTNGFICDTSSNLMGMNSSLKKWNKLIDDLHLGGASDYIELTLPVVYDASNTLNWTNDEGNSGQDVNSFVSCAAGTSSNTVCKVPVSMGFSAYTISTPSSGSSGGSSAGGSGGGSGGGAAANTTTATNTTANVTANEETTSDNATKEETVIEKGVGAVTEAVKNISWKMVVVVLISLSIVGGVIWYFLRDERKSFVEIRSKKK